MDFKRLLLAAALSLGVIVLWNVYLFPPAPPRPPASSAATSKAPPVASTAEPAPPVAPPDANPAAPSASPSPAPVAARAESARQEERTIETALYRVRVSNQGAVISGWQLKNYSDDQGRPLELVSPGSGKVKRFPLGIELADSKLAEKLASALFEMETGPGETGKETRVALHYSDGAGIDVTKTLRFSQDSYVVRLEVDARRDGAPLEGYLIWGAGLGPDDGLAAGGRNHTDIVRAVIRRDGNIVRLPREALKGKPVLAEPGGVVWAGLEDHYFAGIMIPEAGAAGTVVRVHQVLEEGREKNFLSLGLALPPGGKLSLFVGPKDYTLLASLKLGIEGIVDFGFFGSIAHALFFLLQHINRYTGNWGWSIILLTFFIRLAFFPLTQKASVSMRHTQEKMKKIQPRLQAIKDRYRKMKKDVGSRQKMNEEMMALYNKEGVNPVAGMTGCLPLLLQLPILWGFYNLLNSAIELRHAPFVLWITDLSKKDPYYVTPIVMGVTMLIQQVMTGSAIPDPAQRRIMMLMPVMFTWFFKDLPSGLVLYWLVNNILAIGQQYLINAQVEREISAKKVPARG